MNYNQSVEIDDANVVDYNHLRRLARMLDISNDDIRESYNTVKRRLGIKKRVTEKIFNQNKSRFVDELVYIIVDRALELGYSNDDTKFMSFYNFAKGYQAGMHAKAPSAPDFELPPPSRYIDSDVYKQRIQKKADDEFFGNPTEYNDTFVREQHRKKIHLPMDSYDSRSKEQRRLRFDRELHKRDTSAIKEHINDIKEFWRTQSLKKTQIEKDLEEFDIWTPDERREENINNLKSFREWKELGNEQQRIVDDIMEQLERNPHRWTINFEELNNKGRKQLFPRLKEFFEELMENTPIIEMYKIQFKVNGEWKSKPLTPKVMNKLMENLTEQNFIFDLEDIIPDYFYEEGGEELPTWSLFTELSFSPYQKYDGNKDRGGDFFPYLTIPNTPKVLVDYLKRFQIFDSLIDDKGKQRCELNDCCFVYALMMTDCYDEPTLNQIRLRIQNRYLSQGSIEKICQEFHIHIKLSYIDEDTAGKNKKQTNRTTKKNGSRPPYYGVPIEEVLNNRVHHLCIYKGHYFLEEETPFSGYYIKHLHECESDESMFDKEIYHGRVIDGRSRVKSSQLLRLMMSQNYFIPITYGQCRILKTVFFNEINNDLSNVNLDYDEQYCTRLIKPPISKTSSSPKMPPTYWFADFEADSTKTPHRPYKCVIHKDNGRLKKEFVGEDCDRQLLEFLPDGAVVYFHNLAYDIRMIRTKGATTLESTEKEFKNGITKSIIKGTKVMKADVKYNGKTIHFKDSLPILTCKLSEFPMMFNLDGIQKEIFPYKYYTLERLKENPAIGTISEAGLREDRLWTAEDIQTFNENIDSIPGCRIDDDHFDMWKYVSFYCQQDVNILRLGFTQFRNDFKKDFNIDPYNFISISSLANEVFKQQVYYPNGNLFEVGGIVRKFMSQAVYGGRCMTAYNKKWHVKKHLSDFDAVSLYPSAMARLHVVEGRPKVITEDKLNYEFLSNQSAYVVEIEITKVHKHYPFPLIVRKVNGLNLNDDNLVEGESVHMVVDNIALEDLIKFQKIEYRLIKGYYWDGKTDDRIQSVIKDIFNKRLQYKKDGNPLQLVYKLIMNSCYGKTIERPHDKDYKYIHNRDLDKYVMKNYYKIIEDVELENSDMHAVKVMTPIDKHFNFSLLGIQVLSMSKRIMNEVMCLAYDIGCHIYYQDTDSMHIETDDIPKLVSAYKDLYGRDLIGSNLGQFHSDFPTINNHKETPVSVESIFLMKKMYIDKLTDSTGDIDYMIRGKGITQNSIKHEYQSRFDGNPMSLYKHIFDGHQVTFDLTKGQPCFAMNKNMTVSTLEKFQRRIKTTYDIGDVTDYFHHKNEWAQTL